jgi:hypothetical protein
LDDAQGQRTGTKTRYGETGMGCFIPDGDACRGFLLQVSGRGRFLKLKEKTPRRRPLSITFACASQTFTFSSGDKPTSAFMSGIRCPLPL